MTPRLLDNMSPPLGRALVLLGFAASASAQYYDYDGGRNTPARVIAGVVIAICIAILFLLLFTFMLRRRRRGLTVLPRYGGGTSIGNGNQNQGPYRAYPMGSQPQQQQQQPPWAGYQPPVVSPAEQPPPPYPGKAKGYDGEENSGYGYPAAGTQYPNEQAPEYPGGFVQPQSPPHSPPAAHVNTNSPWFRNA